jgi:hypothetical protein
MSRSIAFPSVLLALVALNALPLPVFSQVHGHGDAACATEHGSLSGQIGAETMAQKYKMPDFVRHTSLVNTQAIKLMADHPVTMMVLNGKIVPKSSQSTMSNLNALPPLGQ